MTESEILHELSRRTSLPESTVAAVLKAVRDMVHEGAVEAPALLTAPPAEPAPHPEDPTLVERLISKAKAHPFGVEFLASGLLATVAITLGAHAFTVEAARRRLKREQEAAQKKDHDAKDDITA